ncbi:MAG: M61 family metallopeptidase [Thermoplasmata archaeon]
MKISYTIEMPDPSTQIFQITVDLEEFSEESLTLVMPAWTPGSYLIRDFARHVRHFSVTGENNSVLDFIKKDKSSWKVNTSNQHKISVHYEIYAPEYPPRVTHLDSSSASINGTSAFMYIEGYKDQTLEILIRPYGTWRIYTTLEKIAENRFRAINYDLLADSPIEIGNSRFIEFKAAGKDHEIIIQGPGFIDENKLAGDFSKIVEGFAKMMGPLPYKKYQFIIHTYAEPESAGALEHLSSCSIVVPVNALTDEKGYVGLLTTASHEFFHLWNVKRIRPLELGPFNYKEENYTNWLWFSEGITDYYAKLNLLRSGLITKDRYYEMLSEVSNILNLLPGTWKTTLTESSFDSWIKYYKPSPDGINSYSSYYLKGQYIGLFLNIKVVELTKGMKSLDDLFRIMFEKYKKDGRGFTEKDIIGALKEITGSDFSDFFRSHIKGLERINEDAELSKIGLVRVPAEKKSKRKTSGIVIRKEGEKFTVGGVLEGYPAFNSGINAGDQIIAVNSMRFVDGFMEKPLENNNVFLDSIYDGGTDAATFHYFRNGSLGSVEIKGLRDVFSGSRIVESEQQNLETQKLRTKLMGF